MNFWPINRNNGRTGSHLWWWPIDEPRTWNHIPQGVPKNVPPWTNECKSCGGRELLIQPTQPMSNAPWQWRPIIDLWGLNAFMYCLGALQRGQWLTSLYLKDDYFHVGVNPAGRSYLHFRHDGTSWQLTVVSFRLWDQSEHLPKCSDQYTLPPGEIARVPGTTWWYIQ